MKFSQSICHFKQIFELLKVEKQNLNTCLEIFLTVAIFLTKSVIALSALSLLQWNAKKNTRIEENTF